MMNAAGGSQYRISRNLKSETHQIASVSHSANMFRRWIGCFALVSLMMPMPKTAVAVDLQTEWKNTHSFLRGVVDNSSYSVAFPGFNNMKSFTEKVDFATLEANFDASRKKHDGTKYSVVNSDTLVAGENLLNKGLKPAVVNFANEAEACGGDGLWGGSRAQEEEICRKSNLYFSLSPKENPNPEVQNFKIPEYGVFVSPQVSILGTRQRDGNLQMYDMTTALPVVDVISSAAYIIDPHKINPNWARGMSKKIAAQFLAAMYNGNDAIVVGAFGCGAYGNNPKKVAELYGTALKQYGKYFEEVVFAIWVRPGVTHDPNFGAFRDVMKQQFGRSTFVDTNPAEVIKEQPSHNQGVVDRWDDGPKASTSGWSDAISSRGDIPVSERRTGPTTKTGGKRLLGWRRGSGKMHQKQDRRQKSVAKWFSGGLQKIKNAFASGRIAVLPKEEDIGYYKSLVDANIGKVATNEKLSSALRVAQLTTRPLVSLDDDAFSARLGKDDMKIKFSNSLDAFQRAIEMQSTRNKNNVAVALSVAPLKVHPGISWQEHERVARIGFEDMLALRTLWADGSIQQQLNRPLDKATISIQNLPVMRNNRLKFLRYITHPKVQSTVKTIDVILSPRFPSDNDYTINGTLAKSIFAQVATAGTYEYDYLIIGPYGLTTGIDAKKVGALYHKALALYSFKPRVVEFIILKGKGGDTDAYRQFKAGFMNPDRFGR